MPFSVKRPPWILLWKGWATGGSGECALLVENV